MAEGFDSYHVPQQSRRDKLRVGGASSSMEAAALLPVYDPSLLPSDLLSCAAAAAGGFHNQNHPLFTAAADQNCKSDDPPHPLVKEEGPYQQYLHRLYTNHPHSSMSINPNTVADMNSGDSNDPFVLQPPQFRDLAQSYHNNNALALSLSSHGHDNNPSSHHHNSLSLNLQRYGSTTITAGGYLIPTVAGGGLQQNEAAARSSGPLGPFTGYSSILKGSRFLKPTQQLLEELCEVGQDPPEMMGPADSSLMVDVSMVEGLNNGESSSNSISNCGDAGEFRRKKSRLISMLEEVCRRYRQYYQQMQDVVESFEYVAGFGNAAPYANLAVKAMSKHFRCLKNAITDQLQLNNKECARENPNKSKVESPRLRSSDGVQYGQRLSSSGYLEHQPIWRPQRGLPERAVTVLRAWLFDHFLHPYPTDTDKIMLAKQTGLSRSQVSNWFINARVRLWKPMVEEIHMLETQQGEKSSQREERSNNPSTRTAEDFPNLVNPIPSETPSTSTQRGHEASPHKRTRNDVPDVSRSDERRDLPYELSNAHHHHHHQPHASFGGVNNAVSLTLGLHQNNGMSLSEPFQVNDVQRYGIGLEGGNHEGYVIGGFEAQHRHFARDVYGGQLLHDFVG